MKKVNLGAALGFLLGTWGLVPSKGLADIHFEGNRKTSSAYLQALGEKCQKEQTAEDLEGLKQCLLNTQLFSAVTVEKEAENIRVQVEDRWTLIPIPYVAASHSDERAYGFFILESNFLGRGQTFAGGMTKSNRATNMHVFFQDKSLFFTPWTLSFAASRSKSDVVLFGRGSKRLLGFSEKAQKAAIAPGYEIARHLVLSLQLSQSQVETMTLDSFTLDPPDGRSSAGEGILRFRKSNYRFYFQEGLDANFGYKRDLARSDHQALATYVTASGKFTRSVFEAHALSLNWAAASMQGGHVGSFFRSGESPGFRGIPKEGAWSRAYRTAGIEYMIPLKFMAFGTWTTGAFAESGQLDSLNAQQEAERRSYKSFGVGTYIYLRKIALPGMGLEFGSNSSFESRFVAFSLGLGPR